MIQGLRTAAYNAPDLEKAKAWYSRILGFPPYFDEPFYIGFNVGGYELGLIPDAPAAGRGGVTVYWGVADADKAIEMLLAAGARLEDPIQDVGGGIRTAAVLDPFGNVFGVIENPHFKLSDTGNG